MMRRTFLAVLVAAFFVASFASFGAAPAVARRHAPPTPTPTPVPTPVPTPTPVSEEIRLERLGAQLEAIAQSAPGTLGIAVIDTFRGTRFSVHGDRMFPLASVFKLAVAVAVYRRADQHRLDLDDRVTIAAADLRHGAGPIAAAHPRGNATYTYWQLIRTMLVDSDNTACDVLLHAIGDPAEVQKLVDRMGVHGFAIRKTEADLYADARAHRTFAHGGDNGGTPNAVADLLQSIATQRATLLDGTNEIMSDLDAVRTGPGRLSAGFGPEASFGHKTGSGDVIDGVAQATNDAGILTLPGGRRVIVVALLAESRADEATRDAVLATVARTIYDAYMP